MPRVGQMVKMAQAKWSNGPGQMVKMAPAKLSNGPVSADPRLDALTRVGPTEMGTMTRRGCRQKLGDAVTRSGNGQMAKWSNGQMAKWSKGQMVKTLAKTLHEPTAAAADRPVFGHDDGFDRRPTEIIPTFSPQ